MLFVIVTVRCDWPKKSDTNQGAVWDLQAAQHKGQQLALSNKRLQAVTGRTHSDTNLAAVWDLQAAQHNG